MKLIGIIGAMEEEVSQVIGILEAVNTEEIAGMTFYEGKLLDKDVIVVRSGIGKVNMAVCTQILIDRYKVNYLINTGVAGSLSNNINIGDIVISSNAVNHDVDARGFGYELGVIPRMEKSIFDADKEMITIAKNACNKVNSDINVYVGGIATGDQFVSDKEKKATITKNFDVLCVEMEGAAMAQTAFLNKVPFLIIRAISDKADGSAEMDYAQFEKKAIEHSVKLLKALIETI